MTLKNPITQEQYDAWVAALESGDYKKGTGELRDGQAFCCLGVLDELTGCTSTCDVSLELGDFRQLVGFHAQDRLMGINDWTDSWEPVIDTLKSMSLEELHK